MDNRSDGPIRISNVGSNTQQIESPNANGVADSSQEPKKKTRGPSKLKMHDKGKQKCDEIDFNERNQQIGQESVHLSTLERILAREMVPINIDYWSEVLDEIKNKLWACVKLRYKIHDIHKTHVMQKFTKLWNNYKSELSRKIQNHDSSPNCRTNLSSPKGVRDKVESIGDENSEGNEDIWLHDANETRNGGSLDNAKCKLLNWDGTKVVVVEGTIASTDSKALVHHVPLGPSCWKVWVNHVIVNVPLFRPNREMFVLEDAIGSTIAWPTHFISFDFE
ncbi:hypothetical protein HYC85_028933 [Camellia sinensis]|uniref:DUF8039 domain-containing protein n=1 Tax=Camellia sinensis TaxID=4442 RepID=A0A7J7FWN4_CAMSI|nr:hypothetical protein HYC85_028933 [Camellia sinensis]